jgi:5'-nucleotidase / UDP-sugar diphosphatase
MQNKLRISFFLFSLLLTMRLFASFDFPFVILHTNDLHSFFTGTGGDQNAFSLEKLANDKNVQGHYARLTTLIQQKKKDLKEKGIPHLLVDAGDFYSGTLFHSIAPQNHMPYFPEFEFFEYNGFHATTLGNHEFDPKDNGFVTLMKKAGSLKSKTSIISTNINLENELFKNIRKNIVRSKVYELKHKSKVLRVGVLGILGPDGCLTSTANRKEVTFIGHNDNKSKEKWGELEENLEQEIKLLKMRDKADIIMLLMHGGGSEDEKIARAELGIDIIIAGHTHDVYHKKIENTFISQAGNYGEHLGVMPLIYRGNKLTYDSKKKVSFIPVDQSIAPDKGYMEKVQFYGSLINRLIKKSGYKFDTPIFYNNESKKKVSKQLFNEMGRFVTDNVYAALKKEAPIDLYFTSLALIRENLKENRAYQFSDIFRILPIGIEINKNEIELGSKAVSFYLSKEEVVDLITFLELYSHISRRFTPNFSSNINFKVRSWGIPFVNRIYDLNLNGLKYDDWPEYIHVATNTFVASYVSFVDHKTYGFVSLKPKNSKGEILKNSYVYRPEYMYFIEGLKDESK